MQNRNDYLDDKYPSTLYLRISSHFNLDQKVGGNKRKKKNHLFFVKHKKMFGFPWSQVENRVCLTLFEVRSGITLCSEGGQFDHSIFEVE